MRRAIAAGMLMVASFAACAPSVTAQRSAPFVNPAFFGLLFLIPTLLYIGFAIFMIWMFVRLVRGVEGIRDEMRRLVPPQAPGERPTTPPGL